MNHSHRIITLENCYSVVNLPDSWPGRENGRVRILKEDEQTQSSWGLRENNFIYPEHSVLLLSENNYVTNGIRFSLEDIPGIRLRTSKNYDDITYQIANFSPDLIIFTPSSLNDTRRVMIEIVMMHKVKPSTKIIVMEPDSGILSQLASVWKNFRCISSTLTPTELKMIVRDALIKKKDQLPTIQSLLTTQQWKTVKLLSKGLNVSRVANILNVSTKTTSLHKTAAMKRLGIKDKLLEAWFFSALSNLS